MKEAARGKLKWLVRSQEPVGREGETVQRTTHQAAACATPLRIFLEAQNLCSGDWESACRTEPLQHRGTGIVGHLRGYPLPLPPIPFKRFFFFYYI